MTKPTIGIIPLIDYQRNSYWMVPGYMEGIAQTGGLPVMLPVTGDKETIRQIADSFDGFLFTGGHDVYPALYGEEPIPECGECSEERDWMEFLLLQEILKRDKPLLGICRGIQFLNAALGGTLYQDLPCQRPSEVEHHMSPPYDVPIHQVVIELGSPLYELLGMETLDVNSYHHQAVKELSPQLRVMARATDGLVEAVYIPEKRFVWAVQWHPEFSLHTEDSSRRIFEAFVRAADEDMK